ncbi:MAG: class I SAM-dependent methyltransferase [Lachnospiraceae bacterium]|nr:class I SAM-dependent methyltransferase [Lachnospiraceae bacterium]
MDAYSEFAKVYDVLMEDVPYDEWCGKILAHLGKENINDGLLLDLGCGSGTMTEMLAEAGYDMTGVDLSAEMLEQAERKKELSGHDILYLCQDMREFELYGTVRAVVCVCDSLNYITDKEELVKVFRLVNNYLDPHGVFLFDFNTVHKYRDVIGETTIAENREDCSFIWENYYDERSGINEYDLTLFVKSSGEGVGSGIYRRYDETHFQRGFELDEIKKALEEAGMEFVSASDGDVTDAPVDENSERIFVVAREHGKKEAG